MQIPSTSSRQTKIGRPRNVMAISKNRRDSIRAAETSVPPDSLPMPGRFGPIANNRCSQRRLRTIRDEAASEITGLAEIDRHDDRDLSVVPRVAAVYGRLSPLFPASCAASGGAGWRSPDEACRLAGRQGFRQSRSPSQPHDRRRTDRIIVAHQRWAIVRTRSGAHRWVAPEGLPGRSSDSTWAMAPRARNRRSNASR